MGLPVLGFNSTGMVQAELPVGCCCTGAAVRTALRCPLQSGSFTQHGMLTVCTAAACTIVHTCAVGGTVSVAPGFVAGWYGHLPGANVWLACELAVGCSLHMRGPGRCTWVWCMVETVTHLLPVVSGIVWGFELGAISAWDVVPSSYTWVLFRLCLWVMNCSTFATYFPF